MIIQYRNVVGFQTISFRGPGRLEISQAKEESLCIEAAGQHLDQIRSEVIGGKLHLGIVSSDVVDLSAFQTPIRYRLTIRELTHLRVAGQATVQIPDIDCDELSMVLEGRSNVTLERLTADRLHLKLSDRARLEAKGDVEYQSALLGGNAAYVGEELVSDTTSIRVTGEAAAEIRTNDELDAFLGDGAKLTYVGYPEVHKMGPGTLTRRRKQFTSTRGSEHG